MKNSTIKEEQLSEQAKLSLNKSLILLKSEESKPSRFERFYDAVGKFLGGGKSFAPNELKTFA